MSGPTEGNLNSTTPAAPSGKQNVVFQADSPFVDPITGNLERDITAYPEPASSSLEGTIILAQDLGGTADLPEVVGIQGVPFGNSPVNGYVPVYVSASGQIQWLPGGPVSGLAPWNNMLAPTSLTPPVLSSLTWGNQGSATAAANAGGALYVNGLTGSGANVRHLYKAAPSTPWTFTIGVVPGASNTGLQRSGIVMRESATGKIIAFWTGMDNTGASSLVIEKYTNYTTSSATYSSTSDAFLPPVTWMQVTNDGTNLSWKIAIDGQNFKTILQKSVTDFFTTGPNQIGVGVDSSDNTTDVDALFLHWAGI